MTQADTARYLKQAKDIVLDALQPYSVQVYLFGSRATGTARPTSDIDIAILPHGDLPDAVILAIKDALEESAIPYEADVVNLAKVEKAFYEHVLKTGVLWRDYNND